MNRRISLLLLLGVIVLLALGPMAHAAPATQAPWPTSEWSISTPEEQGMDAAQLAAAFDHIAAQDLTIDSFLVVRHGYLVMEAYGPGYDAHRQHIIYSSTKSVISALIGIALADGLLEGVDQPVAEFFADEDFESLANTQPVMILEDLLTMRSGLEWADAGMQLTYELAASRDWIAFTLDRPLSSEPGTEFNYHNGVPVVLAGILEQVTGSGATFAEERLFDPLGITNYRWEKTRRGILNGSWGLHLTPRDMAKFGYLYLNEGVWDGVQIVPAEWVAASTELHVDFGRRIREYEEGYGYLWWLYPSQSYYAAQGLNGQYIWVVPEQDIVVVFTADLQGLKTRSLKTLLDDYVLAAVVSNDALPPNPDAQTLLADQIAAFGN